MKPRPIHEILAGLEVADPFHKIAALQGHIASEKKRSFRRREFEEALKDFRTKLLARRDDENRPNH